MGRAAQVVDEIEREKLRLECNLSRRWTTCVASGTAKFELIVLCLQRASLHLETDRLHKTPMKSESSERGSKNATGPANLKAACRDLRENAFLDRSALSRVDFARREGVNARNARARGAIHLVMPALPVQPLHVLFGSVTLISGLDPPVSRPIPRGRHHIHGDASGLAASECAPLLPSTQAAVCKDL